MYADITISVRSVRAQEVHLPHTHLGILTRHFAWVVGLCVATLLGAPLLVGWTASVVLLK